MLDLRTIAAVLLTVSFAQIGLGRSLPFDSSSLVTLITSTTLFASYLYLARTLVRLPFALFITIRRTRYARRQYKLNRLESLRDGYVRGFLDTRRWTVAPLAAIDRATVCVASLSATLTGIGSLLVLIGGFMGIALLIILYVMRGSFGWVVADHFEHPVQSLGALPFIRRQE